MDPNQRLPQQGAQWAFPPDLQHDPNAQQNFQQNDPNAQQQFRQPQTGMPQQMPEQQFHHQQQQQPQMDMPQQMLDQRCQQQQQQQPAMATPQQMHMPQGQQPQYGQPMPQKQYFDPNQQAPIPQPTPSQAQGFAAPPAPSQFAGQPRFPAQGMQEPWGSRPEASIFSAGDETTSEYDARLLAHQQQQEQQRRQQEAMAQQHFERMPQPFPNQQPQYEHADDGIVEEHGQAPSGVPMQPQQQQQPMQEQFFAQQMPGQPVFPGGAVPMQQQPQYAPSHAGRDSMYGSSRVGQQPQQPQIDPYAAQYGQAAEQQARTQAWVGSQPDAPASSVGMNQAQSQYRQAAPQQQTYMAGMQDQQQRAPSAVPGPMQSQVGGPYIRPQQGFAMPPQQEQPRQDEGGLDRSQRAAVRQAEMQAAAEKAAQAEEEMVRRAQELSMQEHANCHSAREQQELEHALAISAETAAEGDEEAFQQSLHEARLRSLDQYASDLHRHYQQAGGSVAGSRAPRDDDRLPSPSKAPHRPVRQNAPQIVINSQAPSANISPRSQAESATAPFRTGTSLHRNDTRKQAEHHQIPQDITRSQAASVVAPAILSTVGPMDSISQAPPPTYRPTGLPNTTGRTPANRNNSTVTAASPAYPGTQRQAPTEARQGWSSPPPRAQTPTPGTSVEVALQQRAAEEARRRELRQQQLQPFGGIVPPLEPDDFETAAGTVRAEATKVSKRSRTCKQM